METAHMMEADGIVLDHLVAAPLSSDAMPGRTLPSSSSSDAPPPVETKVTLSSMSN